ncbi:uncharacterized protein LOC123010264 isoform X2 [Tribolium madens]|uniref:uncharacterized protein LOC123010264 isoform X2 n=1 Tax=Tribolium madens TaxID=41895 RepID=UPI001CF75FE0|nr:uncharacterized protein LOC123010264 isoform X2 [Tribolium madens]
MITLRISFLLAIDLEEPVKKLLKKPKFKKKSKSTKAKSKSGKSKSKSAKSKKKPKSEGNGCYKVIEVQKPISYVHIEYELFPKKFKYGADVICWGPVAKIFTKNGVKAFKTVTRDNTVWVPVFLEHYLNPLPTEEIRKLLNQVISVNIKTGKNSVGAKAKADKKKIFYLHKDDFHNDFFAELYSDKPKCDDKEEIRKKAIERILLKLLNFPVNNEIVSWAYNMDDVHAYKICQIIIRRSIGQEIRCKDFNEEDNKKGAKKDKKTKKKKGKKPGGGNYKVDLKIPSHILLSDPLLSTFQVRETGNRLRDIFILISSENILTSFQKQQLCPLIVKIRKINNFPFEILIRHGFSQIYLNCEIPDVCEFKTSMKPVGDTIHFDESRFVITSDLPEIKILEMLQTRRAILKILGVRSIPTKNLLQAKEKKKKNKKKEKQNPVKSGDDVSLAVATFDLSALIKSFHLFKEKGQCYNMRSVTTEKPLKLDCYFINRRFTINELNLSDFEKNPPNSLLADQNLFWRGTTVKFEAHFLTPPHPLFHIKDTSHSYRRILLIIFNQGVAKSLFDNLLRHNYGILGPGPILVPNFLSHQKRLLSSADKLNSENEQVLSGFCIDDSNSFIFYIEGPSNGYFLEVVHQISGLNYSTAKVFYNSEYLFEKRLFQTFFKNCGFLLINLKLPLVEIFRQEKTYIEGNVPVHCFKAIQKLNLILNSNTFKSILSHSLVPTEIELLSFSVEYGYQLRYHFKQLKRSSYCDTKAKDVDLFTQKT